MSNLDYGGPAFPIADYDHQTFSPKNIEETKRLLSGMTLRDYFAAKALQGLASNPSWVDNLDSRAVQYTVNGAYQIADAMLAERAK